MTPGTAVGRNLDYVAAEAATRICEMVGPAGAVRANDAENVFTKALGVLQECGPFACSLYLLSRSGSNEGLRGAGAEETVACRTLAGLISLSNGAAFGSIQPEWKLGGVLEAERVSSSKKKIIEHMVQVASVDLDRLMLIKQVWEQVLTYSRYMARSLREKDRRK
jgi:hypothetical protein